MSPTILVVGATGNTGQALVKTLSELLKTAKFSAHSILALTRSSSGATAQKLAELPNVEVVEKNWVDITADWLRDNNVVRAFMASSVQPSQFAYESQFHIAALAAGVEYVVRISTTAANVRPDCPAYYPRAHWAIEAMLSSPEFERLQWTSLQPNIFSQFHFAPAVELIKNFRKTGKQDVLKLMASEDAPVGVIDSNEVGVFAAHLLITDDVSPHNKARYVLNGPEDITGRQIVTMIEEYIGNKVENVLFQDISFIDQMAAQDQESKTLTLGIKNAVSSMWEGKAAASTTSKEVLQMAAAPKRTPAEIFKTMLEE